MTGFDDIALGTRPPGRWALKAAWIVVDTDEGRRLLRDGEVVIERDRVLYLGPRFEGELDAHFDMGEALIGPGFVDLDALSDLDTTLLAYDNQPGERKGRVWPRSYLDRGPYEMYSPEELAFQKRFAFAQLLLNGITSAAPIASLFYREWGETTAEFESASEAAADMGLRVWLGPAYRSGGMVMEANDRIVPVFDEQRGLRGLEDAIGFARQWHGHGEGLVSALLAPDRVETCTDTLLRRTMDAAADLDCPVRLHMAQGEMEAQALSRLHGTTAPAWLDRLGLLNDRLLAPHATVATPDDLTRYRDAGVTVVHCPLVSGRHGGVLRSFAGLREMGLRVAMGTDTAPPDMLLNLAVGMIACRVAEADVQACRSEQFYDAATRAGGEALRRDDIGKLRPGAKADIAVFDLADPAMAPRIDPIQTLILGASGRVTRASIVDGRLSMRNGEVRGLDMKSARDRAQAQFDKLVEKYPERTAGHPCVAAIFPPSYPLLEASADEA